MTAFQSFDSESGRFYLMKDGAKPVVATDVSDSRSLPAVRGATIYRGNACPEKDRGLAIIGDVGSNIIHRKRLEPDGVGLIGRRIDACVITHSSG